MEKKDAGTINTREATENGRRFFKNYYIWTFWFPKENPRCIYYIYMKRKIALKQGCKTW
jgi:hypothetical protein